MEGGCWGGGAPATFLDISRKFLGIFTNLSIHNLRNLSSSTEVLKYDYIILHACLAWSQQSIRIKLYNATAVFSDT